MKCTLIHNETGEIITNNFHIDTIEDLRRKREMAKKDKLNREFKNLQQEFLGNFIFFIFKNIDYLKKILNDNELVKFIFIGTYTKKDGVLMEDNNITYINKKKLKQMLKINDKSFKEFYNKIINNELLIEKEDKLYINIEYFWHGKEKEYQKLTENKIKDFTRVYIDTTRNLYLNTSLRSHKKLAMIYKLLPYINWKYNVLCTNISETSKELINVLTIADVMDILEYDKSNISRFKQDFYSLKYKDYQIFKTVQGQADYTKSYIIVNPLVFYRGNDINELNYLITLFNLQPVSH